MCNPILARFCHVLPVICVAFYVNRLNRPDSSHRRLAERAYPKIWQVLASQILYKTKWVCIFGGCSQFQPCWTKKPSFHIIHSFDPRAIDYYYSKSTTATFIQNDSAATSSVNIITPCPSILQPQS